MSLVKFLKISLESAHTYNLVKIFIGVIKVRQHYKSIWVEAKRAHRSSLHKAFTLEAVGIEFQESAAFGRLWNTLLMVFVRCCCASSLRATSTAHFAKFTKHRGPACLRWLKKGEHKKRVARVAPSAACVCTLGPAFQPYPPPNGPDLLLGTDN